MNNKKLKKMIKVLVISILIILFVVNFVDAVSPIDIIPIEENLPSGEIVSTGRKIVTILQTVGVVASVVVLIVIGLKYLLGSVEEKAGYKKSLMPYLVGAGLVFTASLIAQVAYDFFSKL